MFHCLAIVQPFKVERIKNREVSWRVISVIHSVCWLASEWGEGGREEGREEGKREGERKGGEGGRGGEGEREGGRAGGRKGQTD